MYVYLVLSVRCVRTLMPSTIGDINQVLAYCHDGRTYIHTHRAGSSHLPQLRTYKLDRYSAVGDGDQAGGRSGCAGSNGIHTEMHSPHTLCMEPPAHH